MKVKVPAGLKASGAALWRSVVEDFDLSEHERAQLLQAARLTDTLDQLQAVLTTEGPTVPDPATGASKPSPVLVELRQQRITLARLLGALRVPDADDRRPQRRTGARGVYQ